MTSDDLQFHAFCLTRTGTRLDEYARAIASRVAVGHAVIDLGSGSGILAFLACRAGARRVYAVEAGDAIVLGERLAAANGFGDRIDFVRKPSTQVVLPERADVLVADIHDTFGLQPRGLAAFIDARDRLLKPGGTLIPARIELLVAPTEAPDLYAKVVDVWRRHIHGIDVSPVRAIAVNHVAAGRFEPGQLLAEPAVITTVDLGTVHGVRVGGSARGRVTRHGTMHGICGSFVTTLADGIEMANVPGRGGTTNFAQAFFPVENPVPLAPDDIVSIAIDTVDGATTRWQVEVTRADGSPSTRFDHSTLHSEVFPAGGLHRQSADYRPALTPWGAMERALLDRFDGTQTSAALEQWLTEQFAETLPSRREAAACLKAIIERCG